MKAQLFVLFIVALFLFTSVVQATPPLPAPSLTCTFSPAAEKYSNSVRTYFDSQTNTTVQMIMLGNLENKDAIREICTEAIPDALLQKIKDSSYCRVAAPGKEAVGGSENFFGGWSYYCSNTFGREPAGGAIVNSADMFIGILLVTAAMFPLMFVAFPMLFIFFVAGYAAIAAYRKEHGLSWYIAPAFFGIIGGIVAAVADRKRWKKMIIIGIAATFLMTLILYVISALTVMY